MPAPEQLPDDLRELAFRNCTEFTHTSWANDLKLLVQALTDAQEQEKSERYQAKAAQMYADGIVKPLVRKTLNELRHAAPDARAGGSHRGALSSVPAQAGGLPFRPGGGH